MADGNAMTKLKWLLPSRSIMVQNSSAAQPSTQNVVPAAQGSHPSLQHPVTAVIQSSSDKDDQAHGLKLLYAGQEPIVDIVAVHGLNGHREKTWTDDNKILWLRDLLPSKLPNARIWTCGYDSRTHTKSYQEHLTTKSLYNHGKELVYDLDSERRWDGTQQRPIIFIAHSLGALLYSDRVREGYTVEQRSIMQSTYGIIFMGVPHQGGQGVTMGRVLLNIAKMQGHTSGKLLKHLEESSEHLQQQLYEFTSISQDFDINFAYETLPTPIWMDKVIEIVPRRSAVIPGTPDAAEFGISQDHRRMTKFSKEDNQDFKNIYRALASMIKKAGDKIEENWQSEGRLKQGSQAYNVPFNIREVPVVGNYVERHQEMKYMEERLLPGKASKQRKIFVLHGLGGIGKTQMSLAYARKHQSKYTAVFWLNGQTRESLKQSIVRIGSQLPKDQISEIASNCTQQGHEQLDDCINEVMEWFSREGNNKWLLIYDNVDRDDSETVKDPEAFSVHDYVPGSDQGSVIITTRQHRLGSLGDQMLVTKMTTEEGLEVLRNRMGSTLIDVSEASKLVVRLGGLPLALAQAASYMWNTGTSMTDYLEFYNTAWNDLMKLEAGPESTLREYGNRNVQTTWTISFEHVKRKNEDAANMLQVWSYIDNRDIWYELFINSMNLEQERWYSRPEWFRRVFRNKSSFREVAGTLLDYSLIEARQDFRSYGMHPVVHEWCRRTVNPDRQLESAFLAVTSVAFGVPEEVERDSWAIQRRLVPHARRFSQRRMDTLEQALERDQKYELHTAFHLLGLLYSCNGRKMWAESETLYRRALSGKEQSLGLHHTSTMRTLSYLSNLYILQGRLVDAEALLQRVQDERAEQYQANYDLWIYSVHSAAKLYLEKDMLVKAEDLWQRALKWCNKAPDSVIVKHSGVFIGLGELYYKQEDFCKSEDMYRQILAKFEVALEEYHPLRLKTYQKLGHVYLKQGRLVEAEAISVQAFKGMKRVRGLDNEETLSVMHSVGIIVVEQGRFADAEFVYQQTLAGELRTLGPTDTLTLATLQNLGKLYENWGKLAEAEALYLQQLGLSKDIPDDRKDASTLETMWDLGDLYRKQGMFGEAEILYQRALTGSTTVLGPEHDTTLGILASLRACYWKKGNRADIVPLYLQELALYKSDDESDEGRNKRVLYLSNDLGLLFLYLDISTKAVSWLKFAYKRSRRLLGSGYETTLDILTNLSFCHAIQGKFAEVEALFQTYGGPISMDLAGNISSPCSNASKA